MKNHLDHSTDDSPIDGLADDDSAVDDPAVGNSALDDPELESLLYDAYDAPPLPRSLLKRLDRIVESEWGASPGLAERRGIAAAGRIGSAGANLFGGIAGGLLRRRWTKVVSLAASVALVVALLGVFSGGGPAFAWSTMIEALEKRGVIQLRGPESTRWLSLKDGVLGERTADASRLLDVHNRVVLEHSADGREIYRRRLPSDAPAASPDAIVLTFLLGDTVSQGELQRFAGARLVEERSTADDNAVVLHVKFAKAPHQFDLALTLDPESSLPTGYEAAPGQTATFATSTPLSYATGSVTALAFPAELEVVDLTGKRPAAEIAANTSEGKAAVSAPEASNVPPEDTDPAAADPQDDQPALFGAPPEWKPVRIVKRPKAEVLRRLDALLAEVWERQEIEPAPPADDEELLRRVYLDLVGRTPSVHEARAYLADESADRYEALVDRLLKSPDHASHLATVWRTFLIPEGVDLTEFGGVKAFDRWLADRFASNDSYDEVARNLLLAEGRLSQSGPLLFYSAVKLDAHELASRTARVFLGMRLECAQCHDHPFEPWSQEDFWSFAAFFARISRPQAELESVSTVMRVRDIDRGEVMLPDTEKVIPPRLLGGAELPLDESSARREQLARWLTGAKNPYFARATANRVWGQMFGKGIVDPVDDFGIQNEPKSPELLELLAGHFINTDFDLRELFRVVALSRAYRLSSGAPTFDERRTEWFAQMNVKTLTAEQVYDCVTVATLLETPAAGDPYDFNLARFGDSGREAFLRQFRTPAGQPTEYHGGIPQALTLMNGTLISSATGLSSSGLLKSLEAPFFTNEQRIEVLYLATLSRRPRPSEWRLLKTYIPKDATGAELEEGLADILWALLNSAEFTMNH